MTDVSVAAAGTPIWIDVATPDTQASTRFYTQLFGWQTRDLGPESGGYVMFELDGKAVAASSPAEPGQTSAWSLYFRTDSADETAVAVKEAGGTVVVEPMDVLDAGRMAVFQDNQGAFFSVWQPGTMEGFDLQGALGTYTWTDLGTNDELSAEAFYPKVFGWEVSRLQMEQGNYTQWQAGGAGVGGINPLPSADIPPHWLVWFRVEDVNAVAGRISELGGKIVMEPMDFGAGWTAIATDPTGATFGVIQMKES